ncbi:MAG TPA: cysteine synthase family protein [Gammaproteobacteria bacterium]|nr:cysteine synthase family protein [Gammaproteobacteria bacterium]
MISDDILGTVGRTPMCRLGKIVPGSSAEIVAKLEFFEPGGSIKDRAAVSMLDAAVRDGRLKPGMTVVEASGGNTGVGLAMACAVRGHPCVIVLPSDTSKEKIAVLRTFGAEVIRARTDVPGPHPEGYVGRAKAYARDHGAFLPDQFTNPANPAAHEASTALEILEQCEGKLDAFVACVGSGGTIAGTGRVLRSRLPSVVIVGAATQAQSVVEGVTDEIDAEATHGTPPDRVIEVSDADAIRSMLRLARDEGILAGASSGVALVAALRVAAELGPGKRVVTMVTDTGRNYLSSYFDPEWRRQHGFDA